MKPILVNNSKIPIFLSIFSPIDIWAITIWPFIFCRGEMNDRDIRHETTHIEQCNDLLVVGTVIIYLWDYFHGLIKYRNDISGLNSRGHPYTSVGDKAYHRTRAEQEAYSNDHNLEYLEKRKRREWLSKYKV
jgi:hypothetical protein